MRPSLRQFQPSAAEITMHARLAAPLGVELSSKGWRKGDGFYSRKNETDVIACARAMASCPANAATAPCPRSYIPRSRHGGSEKGPLMASPGPTWSGIGRAGGRRARPPPASRPLVVGQAWPEIGVLVVIVVVEIDHPRDWAASPGPG